MSVNHAAAVAEEALGRQGFRLSRRAIAASLVLLLLLGYYAAVFLVHNGEAEQEVVLADGNAQDLTDDYMHLELKVTDLDPSQRVMTMELQPVPHGSIAIAGGGELVEPVILRVTSPRRPPLTFDFTEEQVLDPVSVPLSLSTGAYAYPFDTPGAQARFEVISKETNTPIPVDVALTNSANDWRLSGSATDNGDAVMLRTEAERDTLIRSLAIFYLFAIGLTAFISVAIIGASLMDFDVSFSEVIWLGATLIAIPAIRNEMPGAPSIGTAVDVFVFFPAVGMVALTLLAATVVLAFSTYSSREAAGDKEEVDLG
jgi:hypothetical protein